MCSYTAVEVEFVRVRVSQRIGCSDNWGEGVVDRRTSSLEILMQGQQMYLKLGKGDSRTDMFRCPCIFEIPGDTRRICL